MSRTVTSSVSAAARTPAGSVIVRDTRVRFASWQAITNPHGLTDPSQLDSPLQDAIAGDMVVFGGEIFRAWGGQVQRITTPTTGANWSSGWTAAVYSGDTNNNAGFWTDGASLRLFYKRHTGLYYRVWSGSAWGSENTLATGLVSGVGTVAADVCFVCVADTNGDDYTSARIYRVGASSVVESPRRLHASIAALTGDALDVSTYFDAFTLNGRTFVVYALANEFRSWVMECTDGVFAEPHEISDASIAPYRTTVIGDKVFLTCRVEREEGLAFDGYLYSADGENWTRLARDCFIATAELRGAMVVVGDYAYYAGWQTVYRAPAGYLFGVTNASLEHTITTRLTAAEVSFPGSGTAPTAQIALADGADYYRTTTTPVHVGSEFWTKLGYGNNTDAILRATIDSLDRVLANGARVLNVRGLDSSFARLTDWTTLFYHDLRSQGKVGIVPDTSNFYPALSGLSWPVTDGVLSFSTQLSESIMLSTDPYETADFDVRAKFEDVASVNTDTDRTQFGLVGLYIDADNYVLLRVKRGTTNNVTLEHRSGGTYTVLGTASATVAANADYWVRLVHRGGRFTAWVKTTKEWSTATLTVDYDTSALNNLLCNSTYGAGKVGIFGYINAISFKTWELDDLSTVVPLREDPDSVWGIFPSSGTIKLNDEVITYTSKSAHFTTAWGDLEIEDLGQDYGSTNGRGATWVYENRHYVRIKDIYWSNISEANALTLVFGSVEGDNRRAPNGLWWTINVWYQGDGLEEPHFPVIHCDDTGHVQRWESRFIDKASPIAYLGEYANVALASALKGCTRGAEEYHHPRDSRAVLYQDDVIKVHSFECFDMNHDYNTERLLQRGCAYAGVFGLNFEDTVSDDYESTTASGYGAFVPVLDVDADELDALNIDVAFTLASLANNTYATMLYRVANDSYPVGSGGIRFSRSGSTYTVALCEVIEHPSIEDDYIISTVESDVIAQVPLSGSFDVRVVIQDTFATVWVGGAIVLNGVDASLQTFATNGVRLVSYNATSATHNWNDFRVAELSDWRDAIHFGPNASGQAMLGEIIADRQIPFFSRSGETLKFSYKLGTNLGAFPDILFSDSEQDEGGEITTVFKVEGLLEGIFEFVDADLIAAHGMVVRVISLPRSTYAFAQWLIARLFRGIKSRMGGHSADVAADLRVEPNDYLEAAYTASGTGTAISKDITVNDVTFSFSEANLTMRLGARDYIANE